MEAIFTLICDCFRWLLTLQTPGGKRALVAEMLALKAQLLVVKRKQTRIPSLGPWWRLFFAVITPWLSPKRLASTAIVIKPSTLLNLHKWLVARKYSKLFGTKKAHLGRPRIETEIRKLVVEIKKENPAFGCPQIAAIVTDRTGVAISQETVRRILMAYLPRYKGKGPSWLSFIGTQAESLWSLDMFRAESITLQSHWVLVVMDHFSRKDHRICCR